ncbi:AraC family transcriptional regulator [Streptomyces guryensis]|uniref:AraC family transcriptional regulator n=1 Tax=Streptomyces guryensis TaxID=2886947 RepID=A0A9Q3ZF56_9ACTN|nr:AraC family transcriptional regulator [Streptomyces guryensis]MCD9880185.1 AraC family transcriptional regulator [Streptomyces guryensis]
MIVPPVDFADRPASQVDLLRPQHGVADPPGLEDAALGLDVNGQPYDLLSELLRTVRLSGERIAAYGPLRTFSVGFSGTGTLHIVDEGEVLLRIDGAPHVERASHGDVILLPRGDPHRISDAGERAHASVGASGHDAPLPQPARWLCGTFTIGDPQASHLLASLPAVIILRGARGPALEGLEVARRMLLLEMQSPSQGSAVMVARILDLLFIQILRAWAAGTGAEPNWLAGALDPEIGPALSAIHRDPGHRWTVEELARACCLSRSAFAARFVARVGKPPATYLAHVRLDAAADLLRDTSLPAGFIGENVGYTSEAAFSRAFKHRYGKPPALWRRDTPARHS